MAGDPYKDDLEAAHARLLSLERENAQLRGRLEMKPPVPARRPHTGLRIALYAAAAVLAVAIVALVGTMARIAGGRGALAVVAALALFGALVVLTVSRLRHVCGPNEALVIFGRKTRGPDGTTVGYRIVRGGRYLRLPFIERAHRVDLTALTPTLDLSDVAGKGGATLALRLSATVRVGGSPQLINRFVERFLDHPRQELSRIVADTLEGAVRVVVAARDPEALERDRELFSQELSQAAREPLATLGFSIDQLNIGSMQRRAS